MFHVKHRGIFISFMAKKKNPIILIYKDNEVLNFSLNFTFFTLTVPSPEVPLLYGFPFKLGEHDTDI